MVLGENIGRRARVLGIVLPYVEKEFKVPKSLFSRKDPGEVFQGLGNSESRTQEGGDVKNGRSALH